MLDMLFRNSYAVSFCAYTGIPDHFVNLQESYSNFFHWQKITQFLAIELVQFVAVCGHSSSRCNIATALRNSHAIWDHTMLPTTRQR